MVIYLFCMNTFHFHVLSIWPFSCLLGWPLQEHKIHDKVVELPSIYSNQLQNHILNVDLEHDIFNILNLESYWYVETLKFKKSNFMNQLILPSSPSAPHVFIDFQ